MEEMVRRKNDETKILQFRNIDSAVTMAGRISFDIAAFLFSFVGRNRTPFPFSSWLLIFLFSFSYNSIRFLAFQFHIRLDAFSFSRFFCASCENAILKFHHSCSHFGGKKKKQKIWYIFAHNTRAKRNATKAKSTSSAIVITIFHNM